MRDLLDKYQSRLPPPSDCHTVMDCFRSCSLIARDRTMPRPCTQHAYDALWSCLSDLDASKGAQQARLSRLQSFASHESIAFIAMVFSDLAIGYWVMPDIDDDSRDTAMKMYELSRRALTDSESRESPSYCTIMTLLSQTVWVKLVGSFSVSFTYVGRAIRHAQSMVSRCGTF